MESKNKRYDMTQVQDTESLNDGNIIIYKYFHEFFC